MREHQEVQMYLAVAVETSKHPSKKQDYKIWYLEVGPDGKVQGVGVKNREDLITSIFENYRLTGNTNWRCFQKEREESTSIEIYDFIAMNNYDNTHFGNLPTLSEFQLTLDSLQANLELRSIA
jgi:hypothetical protein